MELTPITAPDTLTDVQHKQMNADLARLLPADYFEKTAAPGTTPPIGKKAPIEAVTLDPKVQKPMGAWRYRRYPMGGWVYHDKPARMQRVDQGQDFEIPLGAHIISPGWGKCVSHLHDGPWPSGFGSPYAVVYIGSGRFGGRLWYIGHNNEDVIPAGWTFHIGRVLSRPNHSLNYGWGWTELGHAANGYPMSFGEGARWHSLFTPVWRWGH